MTIPQQGRNLLGVFLVHRNHQTTGVGMLLAQLHQLGVGMSHDGGQPVSIETQRRPQPLVRQGPRQRVLERRRHLTAVGGHPFHLPTEPREEHGSDHPPIGQCLAVSVLDVGDHLIGLVQHEGDGSCVTTEWRTGQGQAPGRRGEGLAHPFAPGPFVTGVMDLVQDHETAPSEIDEGLGRGADLLVGRDDTVHVLGEPIGR